MYQTVVTIAINVKLLEIQNTQMLSMESTIKYMNKLDILENELHDIWNIYPIWKRNGNHCLSYRGTLKLLQRSSR